MDRETFTNRVENRGHLPVCDERNEPISTNRRAFHVHVSIPDERELASMGWADLSNYVEEQIEIGLPLRHQKSLLQNKPGVVCIKT